jgi:hypothetical protein
MRTARVILARWVSWNTKRGKAIRRHLEPSLIVISVSCLLFGSAIQVLAHDPNATITWNREISRIIFERCASCHRPGSTSFSLMTFKDTQPRAAAIKDSVLARRMPPWGAVEGFGDFRNDEALSQEQITLIAQWVETGTLRGNNPNVLPAPPTFGVPAARPGPAHGLPVSGEVRLDRAVVLDGLVPERMARRTASMPIVAVRPDGSVEPLVWLYEFQERFSHPFLFRRPIALPAGTIIRGVPSTAAVLLLPVDLRR